jgi:hypothetical protein
MLHERPIAAEQLEAVNPLRQIGLDLISRPAIEELGAVVAGIGGPDRPVGNGQQQAVERQALQRVR